MEFLTNLDPIQWIFLGIGVILAAPVLLDFFKGDSKPKVKGSNDLSDLIKKWEELADAVDEVGICDACDKLDEVFPLLIQARKTENKNEQ